MHWFRFHHGTCSDPKLGMIARRLKLPTGMVLSLWVYHLEEASQAEDRGYVGHVDPGELAYLMGYDPVEVVRVIHEFRNRKMIDHLGFLTAWKKRNPKREDPTNAQRQRDYRKRQATMELVPRAEK